MKKKAEIDINEIHITQKYALRNKLIHDFSFYFNPYYDYFLFSLMAKNIRLFLQTFE